MTTENKIDNFLLEAAGSEGSATFGDMDSSTMQIPFLKIAQSMSKELSKKSDKYIEGLEVGMFYNNVTKKVYDELKAIIIGFEHMYNEWMPDRGGLVARHKKSDFRNVCVNPDDWGNYRTEDGNDLVETYMYYLLIVGEEDQGPVVFSATKSQIKQCQAWNRMASTLSIRGKKLPREYGVYCLTSVERSSDKGDWFVLKAERREGEEYINQDQLAYVKREILSLPDSEKVNHSMMIAEGNSSDEETKF